MTKKTPGLIALENSIRELKGVIASTRLKLRPDCNLDTLQTVVKLEKRLSAYQVIERNVVSHGAEWYKFALAEIGLYSVDANYVLNATQAAHVVLNAEARPEKTGPDSP